MRFLYGLIFGVLASLIAAILYLAMLGGEYLLILSPQYQEMRSRLNALEKAEAQRDQLTERLRELERRFTELSERFTGIAGEEPSPAAMPTIEPTASPTPDETPGTAPDPTDGDA